MHIQRPRKSGKINFNTSQSPVGTESNLESMENQLISGGHFPGRTTLQILTEIQDELEARQTSPEEFEDRISMSMFNDIDWTTKGHFYECFSNSEQVKDFAKRFPLGHWSFLGPGEGKWYGTHTYKLEGQ